MATSLAFSNFTLSVHSSRPPTAKATRWSNTRGSGGAQCILAVHGGVSGLPNMMGAPQVVRRLNKEKEAAAHGQGSLAGYSPWGRKRRTRLSD